jgi:APA family basic amino acid/polyamine antiporter
MFHTKPVSRLLEEASESGSHTLRRSLGAQSLVAIGVGVSIGAGLVFFIADKHIKNKCNC